MSTLELTVSSSFPDTCQLVHGEWFLLLGVRLLFHFLVLITMPIHVTVIYYKIFGKFFLDSSGRMIL